MTSIKLTVSGASARAEVDGLLTSGMVGVPVAITYDSAWDGLTKALVCRGGSVIRTILDVDGTATVPHECMIANATLQIGVEGRNDDGTLVIPTIWARCGLICSGANAEADPSTDPTLPVWAQIQAMIGNLDDLESEAKNNLVDAVNEAMTKGGGTVDPKAVQQIVEGYLAENPPTVTETDPTVPAWAKAAQKPSYTASEVGADPSGTAAAQVAAHNTGTDTHSDIRLLISGLTDRLNALADSDDTTLDQLSEVVAYIKANRELIASITRDKVSVADIVDNLTTNATNKPLSAAQGVALKALIDAITVPDKLPNPNALTFTGAVTGSYDGSASLEVEIPSGSGDETELPIIQEYTIEGDETSSIVFTGLPNISEFLLRIAWEWQRTAYSGTVRVSFSETLAGYNDRVGRISTVNTGVNQTIIIRGKPIAKNREIVVISAAATNSRDVNESMSVSRLKSTSVISVWWADSGKYFPAGATVSLRGK